MTRKDAKLEAFRMACTLRQQHRAEKWSKRDMWALYEAFWRKYEARCDESMTTPDGSGYA